MRTFAATRRAFLASLTLPLAALTGCNLMDTSSGLAPEAAAPGPEVAQAPASKGLTFWGPAVPLGDGIARTFYTLDAAGNPTAVGVDLSERALQGLPTEGEETSYVLKFHPGGVLPYTHVYLGWNPQGHEPMGVYDLPHFDVHFYLVPSAERAAIGPFDDAQFANAPAPEYIPTAYLQIPGGVPQMGAHWVDLLAPEFNGGTFSRTFIWGTYDGEVTFLEPMITLTTLQAATGESVAIRQPAAWQKDGYYPVSYRISAVDHPAGVRISLEGLTFRAAE